jgi:pilus assembly protein Flp/PilA
VVATLHVSTGNGDSCWSKNGGPEGGFVGAATPRGDSTVFKHISRWRRTYLGGWYKPWYSTLHYAVHGSRSVPAVLVSHGSVRIPLWEGGYLDDFPEIGMPIHIWMRSVPFPDRRKRECTGWSQRHVSHREWAVRPMVHRRPNSYYHNMMSRTTELYMRTSKALRAIVVPEGGASMVEYALLIALIAVVAVVAVTLFGVALDDEFDRIANSVPTY